MKRFFLIALSILILASCKQSSKNQIYGYIEGDNVYISSTSSGLVDDIYVKKGRFVEKDTKLFVIDDTLLKAELNKSVANIEKAKDYHKDLVKGKRPQEIDVINKQLWQAQSVLNNAKSEYERNQSLYDKNIISQSKYDTSKTNYDVAIAKLKELGAELATAKLGARKDKIEEAKKDIYIAEQQKIQAHKKLSEATRVAPTDAIVEDVFYEKGEYVQAGSPIISLLPPANIKARFYVPEELVSSINLGQEIEVSCDNCQKQIKASISYISPRAEFTPPVIYSVESRKKLVFMVEASFTDYYKELHPGLPIDIRIPSHDQK